MAKPKVQVDEDGDGDVDVTVEIDTPAGPVQWPAGVRDALRELVSRMEVHISPPVTRVTYATTRETLRGILNNNP